MTVGDLSQPTWERVGTRCRRFTAPLRMLPDFLIIGAQRAGTTSLFSYLARHPCIAPPALKEVHYFDLHFGRGLELVPRPLPDRFQDAVRAPRSPPGAHR